MKTRVHAALVALFAIAIGSAASGTGAQRITLNDTGMTQCIDHNHKEWVAECATSGQDAAYGRDVSSPDPEDGAAQWAADQHPVPPPRRAVRLSR